MKTILLWGISFGIVMAVLWSVIFTNILGPSGIGVGICLGASFAACGCLFGYAINKSKKEGRDSGDKK